MSGVEMRKQDKLNENGVFVTRDFEKDGVLLVLEGEETERPTQTSLQIGFKRHLEGGVRPWHNLNHSCNPNAYVNYDDFTLRALRPIHSREEITFDYNSTEYDIQVPFECLCGAQNCRKIIKGFKHLSKEEQKAMYPLAPYLQKLLPTN